MPLHDLKAERSHYRSSTDHPLLSLDHEDLTLITELVLASGSLKDLARAYGVSYPTIRLRLNGVIDRLRDAVEGRTPDPVTRLVADLVERGELNATAARRLLEVVRTQAAGDRNGRANDDDR